MSRFLASCLVIGLLAFSLPHVTRAETLLRWDLSAGDKLAARYEQQTSSTVLVAGKPAKTSLDVNLDLLWQVESVADGKATIQQTIERVDLKMRSPGADPIEFDTASQATPAARARQLATTLMPLVGRKLSTVMTDRGDVLDNEPTKPADEPSKITPSGTPPPVSAAKIRRLSGQTLIVLPEKAVEKGDTWTAKSDIAGPLGIIQQTVEYTYVGPTERAGKTLEQIDFVAKFNPPADEKLSANLTVKEQIHSGTVYFDATAGHVAEAEQSQKLMTETKYRDSTVTVELETTLRTTLTRK